MRDTGIGISEEDQEKIFERFAKLNSFVLGTGLGLSICQTIVKKMGGRIGTESEGRNKGSNFWFTVPYQPGEEKKPVVEVPVPQAVIRQDFIILIAEDNESNYLLFKNILSGNTDCCMPGMAWKLWNCTRNTAPTLSSWISICPI